MTSFAENEETKRFSYLSTLVRASFLYISSRF